MFSRFWTFFYKKVIKNFLDRYIQKFIEGYYNNIMSRFPRGSTNRIYKPTVETSLKRKISINTDIGDKGG